MNQAGDNLRPSGTLRFLLLLLVVLGFLALSAFALYVGLKATEQEPSLMTAPKAAPVPSALPAPTP